MNGPAGWVDWTGLGMADSRNLVCLGASWVRDEKAGLNFLSGDADNQAKTMPVVAYWKILVLKKQGMDENKRPLDFI